jgi:hypothetical protein
MLGDPVKPIIIIDIVSSVLARFESGVFEM